MKKLSIAEIIARLKRICPEYLDYILVIEQDKNVFSRLAWLNTVINLQLSDIIDKHFKQAYASHLDAGNQLLPMDFQTLMLCSQENIYLVATDETLSELNYLAGMVEIIFESIPNLN